MAASPVGSAVPDSRLRLMACADVLPMQHSGICCCNQAADARAVLAYTSGCEATWSYLTPKNSTRALLPSHVGNKFGRPFVLYMSGGMLHMVERECVGIHNLASATCPVAGIHLCNRLIETNPWLRDASTVHIADVLLMMSGRTDPASSPSSSSSCSSSTLALLSFLLFLLLPRTCESTAPHAKPSLCEAPGTDLGSSALASMPPYAKTKPSSVDAQVAPHAATPEMKARDPVVGAHGSPLESTLRQPLLSLLGRHQPCRTEGAFRGRLKDN